MTRDLNGLWLICDFYNFAVHTCLRSKHCGTLFCNSQNIHIVKHVTHKISEIETLTISCSLFLPVFCFLFVPLF